jgi:simple sugar transport system substrate-binding protein
MRKTYPLLLTICLLALLMLLPGCTGSAPDAATATPDQEFVFGLILVGPKDDHGWSEAHYKGGRYVEAQLPKSRMLYLDELNPGVRPEMSVQRVVTQMVEEGARLILVTSDDFGADTLVAAQEHPEVVFIHISGDHVLQGNAPANLGNLMTQMEYGKMIAGCAAALATRSGSIAYVGPLINNETRRMVNASYLGARYCYDHLRTNQPAELQFRVEWIGFWFHIPGVTADPMLVTHDLFDSGSDVILSGIDTTEVIVVTGERASNGEKVLVVPYDYEGACNIAPDVCLGVPYFNWGPDYLNVAHEIIAGTWHQRWDWPLPDWQDINDPDKSPVGFLKGPALTSRQAAQLDSFIAGLANSSISLFKGPLYYQDQTVFLNAGEVATDKQIWYMSQLLAGVEGIGE